VQRTVSSLYFVAARNLRISFCFDVITGNYYSERTCESLVHLEEILNQEIQSVYASTKI
jgi:hypothetical protein